MAGVGWSLDVESEGKTAFDQSGATRWRWIVVLRVGMDEIRGGLWSKYIEVDHVQTRLSVLLCILSSISVMPLGFDAGVRLDCLSLGVITKGTTRLQYVNPRTRCAWTVPSHGTER